VNQAQIDLVDESGRRRPGERVEGVVSWSLDVAPTSVVVALVWHTEGKGTTDTEVVHRTEIDDADAADSRTFSFEIPPSPWSFSGTLISLVWAVELMISRPGQGDLVERRVIVVGPAREEVDLTTLPVERDE